MPSGKPSKRREQIDWIEIPVFIHGISPDKDPIPGKQEYNDLLTRVKDKLKGYPGKKLSNEKIYVVWGTPTTPSQYDGTDQYLAEVERQIQAKVKEAMGPAYSNPFGLTGYVRDLLFFGISDLFYYISADGELDLREHVFGYISNSIQKLDKDGDKYFSLTIFGHSAGSVIAHDLLYHLFSDKKLESEKGTYYREDIRVMRNMADQGRLRVRRFYTFGSPISLLVLRADSLIKKFRSGELFKLAEIGLDKEEGLGRPRWVNFWSRHDLASYPVEFLYSNENGVIEDREVTTSLSPKTAHTAYWTSDEMAEYVAKSF